MYLLKNKFRGISVLILISIILMLSLFLSGCNKNYNEIESVTYKTSFDSYNKTIYSYYISKISHLEILDNESNVLETIYDYYNYCCYTGPEKKVYYSNDFGDMGHLPSHIDRREIVNRPGMFYNYSTKYNCVVTFKIYFENVIKNYPINIKYNQGMAIVEYYKDKFGYSMFNDSLNSSYSWVYEKNTISVPQENISIVYN